MSLNLCQCNVSLLHLLQRFIVLLHLLSSHTSILKIQRAPPAEREEGHYRQQFPAQLQVLVTANHVLLARRHIIFSKKKLSVTHAAAFSISIAFSPKLDADFPWF